MVFCTHQYRKHNPKEPTFVPTCLVHLFNHPVFPRSTVLQCAHFLKGASEREREKKHCFSNNSSFPPLSLSPHMGIEKVLFLGGRGGGEKMKKKILYWKKCRIPRFISTYQKLIDLHIVQYSETSIVTPDYTTIKKK